MTSYEFIFVHASLSVKGYFYALNGKGYLLSIVNQSLPISFVFMCLDKYNSSYPTINPFINPFVNPSFIIFYVTELGSLEITG